MSSSNNPDSKFLVFDDVKFLKNIAKKNSLPLINNALIENFAKNFLWLSEKSVRRGTKQEIDFDLIKDFDDNRQEEERMKITDFKIMTDEEQILQYLLNLLNITPIKRIKRDIIYISEFLESTDLFKKFKNDKMDESILNKLLFYCSNYIEYQSCKAGEILFKIYEKADRFYVILKGDMMILKPMLSSEVKMNAEQYFFKLIELCQKNESELVRYTIKENYDSFPIQQTDLNNLREILFKIKYRKSIYANEGINFENINSIFQEFEKNMFLELELDPNADIHRELLKRKSINYLLKCTNDFNIKSYLYLENTTITRTIKLYTYDHFHTLKKGNIFGDFGLENKTQSRTATIQAINDCHLGYINIRYYHEFISYEKQKIAARDLHFILSNFFFKNIPQNVFKMKYFSDFISCDYTKGDYLFRENTEADYIYFIKEGEVHLSISNINLREINSLISNLSEKIKLTEEPTNFEEISEAEVSKKRKIELFHSGIKQVLGVEEQCFGLKRYCSAKVLASKTKIIKISYKLIEKIYKEEDINGNVIKFAKDKILKLIYRLKEFRRIFYQMIQSKKQMAKEDLLKIKEEDKFKSFLESKKSPKINSIEQILNVKEREYVGDNSVIGEYSQKKFCYKNNVIKIEDMQDKLYIPGCYSPKDNNFFVTDSINLPNISSMQYTRNSTNPNLLINISRINNTNSRMKGEKINEKTYEQKQINCLDTNSTPLNIISYEDALMKKIKNKEKNTFLRSNFKNESSNISKHETDETDFNNFINSCKKQFSFNSANKPQQNRKKKFLDKINCRLIKWRTERNSYVNNSKKEEKDEEQENSIPISVKQFPCFKVRSTVNYIYNKKKIL